MSFDIQSGLSWIIITAEKGYNSKVGIRQVWWSAMPKVTSI